MATSFVDFVLDNVPHILIISSGTVSLSSSELALLQSVSVSVHSLLCRSELEKFSIKIMILDNDLSLHEFCL